jgi:hypothetical protein
VTISPGTCGRNMAMIKKKMMARTTTRRFIAIYIPEMRQTPSAS